jgi:ribosomal protein L12E/L44/L45/RPP1/RPP2
MQPRPVSQPAAMATEAQHRGSERQQPDGCAESSSESSDEESDDEGVGRSSLEASAMMCRDLQ